MILFLRNEKNQDIVDLECWIKSEDERRFVEISVSIDIKNYSEFLLNNIDKKEEIISDFNNIDELRGWLWENYFMGRQNNPDEYGEVIKILKIRFNYFAKKYNLRFIED